MPSTRPRAAPRRSRRPRRAGSTTLAAAQVAARRGERRRRPRRAIAISCGHPRADVEAAHDRCAARFVSEPEHEQDHREIEERRRLQLAASWLWNWLAMRLGQRVAVAEQVRADRPTVAAPITCVTAIASPSARPRPRIAAPRARARCDGSTTPRTISQRVAPSASAPSWSSRGTLRKSSRLIEAMIGTTMIVRIDAGGEESRRRSCDGVAEERQDPAERACSAGSTSCLQDGASTMIPQKPSDHARDRREHLDQRPDHGARRRRGASRLR